jgi:hypothetical protein
MPPVSTPYGLFAHHAKRWTPLGIIGALVIGYYALGGQDGIIKIARAMSAEEALLSEVVALRADIKTEREERAKILARMHAFERNQSNMRDFVSSMNGGKPNPTWGDEDGRSIAIDVMQSPPPYRTTSAVWVHPPK